MCATVGISVCAFWDMCDAMCTVGCPLLFTYDRRSQNRCFDMGDAITNVRMVCRTSPHSEKVK